MKKTKSILIFSLLIFVSVQAVLIAVFAISFNSKISLTYEKSVKKNIDNVSRIIAQVENISEIDFSQIESYDFSNIILVSSDGLILKTKKTIKEETIFRIWNLSIEDFKEKEYIIGETQIAGEDMLIMGTSLSMSGDKEVFKLVAYEPLMFSKNFISSEVIKLIVIAIAQFLLSGGLVFATVSFIIKKSDEFSYLKTLSVGYHVFCIDKTGYIYSASKSFLNEFEIQDLSHLVVDSEYSFSKSLSNLLPISFLIANKKGENIYLKCIIGKVFKGYKLIAIDETESYNKKNKLQNGIYLESMTGLENEKALEKDFENAMSQERKFNLSLSVFELKNLENILILFGKDTVVQIIQKCAELFKQKFDSSVNIYFIDQKTFIIFTQKDDETLKIKELLHEFNEILNSPIQLDENLIQVHSYVAHLNFTNKEPILLKELLQYVEYLIANLEKEKRGNIVSQVFTKSKYNFSIGAKKAIAKTIIDEKQLDLFFQPQVRLSDNKIVSFESLVRLKKEDIIDMTTQEFIIISELNGYMIPLGDIIFDKAFSFSKRLQGSDVCVGINISPIQLMQAGFIENFLSKYRQYNLSDHSISIEITETFLMRNIDENIAKLKILQDNKIDIHLDDFGMGYSSLSYLKKLPINAIKIDKEFITDIAKNKYSKSIAKIIIEICKDLNLYSIAEGVETIDQNNALKSLGCDIIQGFLHSKAISANDAVNMILKKGGMKN